MATSYVGTGAGFELDSALREHVAERSEKPLRLTTARSFASGWHPEVRLIEVYDSAWDRRKRVWVMQHEDGRLWPLTGTSPAIHTMRNDLGLRLSKPTVLPFLKFFCRFVYGKEEHGGGSWPFLVVDEPETLAQACCVEVGDERVQRLVEHIRPAKIEVCEAASYRVTATVFYAGALFYAVFQVSRDGTIEMLDDEPVKADTGLKAELPLI